jgi:hypothetical protein
VSGREAWGANTFLNPHNASGMGMRIPGMAWVVVSCKVYAPAIAGPNPDGYRIALAPWNNQYYAVVNTFWNGRTHQHRPRRRADRARRRP